jgi:hypothetical protein
VLPDSDLKSRLQKHIAKTGYPLEITIASTLEDRGWNVVANSMYVDPDTSKLREIDLQGFRIPEAILKGDLGPGPLFWAEILVECKKISDDSLVLFPRKPFGLGDMDGQVVDFPALLKSADSSSALHVNFLSGLLPHLVSSLHYKELKGLSNVYTLTKPGSKRESRPDVFEAVTVLMKAQALENESWVDAHRSPSQGATFYPLVMSFLVIVLDAPMYDATVSSGQVELTESVHSAIRASHYSKQEARTIGFTIDVVTPEFFSKYLDTINHDVIQIAKELKENRFIEQYLRIGR